MENQDSMIRLKLIRCAIACIDEKGLHNFSIRELGKRTRMTSTPIYNRFTNKQEIIDIVYNLITNSFIKKIDSYKDLPTDEQLIQVVALYLKEINKHPNIAELIFLNPEKVESDGPSAQTVFKEKVNSLIEELNNKHSEEFFLKIWSQIHGTAMMIKNGIISYNYDEIYKSMITTIKEAA